MSQDYSRHQLVDVADAVRLGARALARTSTRDRNAALQSMADALRAHQATILEANQRDLDQAQTKDLDDAFIDRLRLNTERVDHMAQAIEEILQLPDPIGSSDEVWTRPNGLKVARRRIPLGTVGMIYESRPNVTSDASALCLKSGNGILLKGGSDAFFSNQAIVDALRHGLDASPLPDEASNALGFVSTKDRQAVQDMLALRQQLDVIIPRGGKGLIQFVTEHSQIPVIKHDEGVCHIVVDGSAQPEDIRSILLNAKTQRPGVCNAVETLLVLQSAVEPHLDDILRTLHDAGVKLHLDDTAMARANALSIPADKADDEAYLTEYLALELAIRVVDDLDDAIAHIDRYGSQHTEAILSDRYDQTQRFIDRVDSSVVLVNASTRFSDGGQLGLGAEIGISTTRMHAYGPMGLRELTTTKFVVLGRGQIRN